MSERNREFAERLLGAELSPGFRSKAGKRGRSGADCPHPDPAVHAFAGSRPGRYPQDVDVVPSVCFSCNTACEARVLLDKKSGRVLRVQGDPDSPITGGILCAKGLAAADLVNNPERLRYPLVRTGERGAGAWERVSWDEALELATAKILFYREKYGPQGLAFLEGTRRGWSRVFSRLANVLGAVNHGAAGWAQCLWPRLVDCRVTFGAQYTETADFRNSHCVLVWGSNPPSTWPVQAADIMEARQQGAALIVVDPYLSETAAKADLWLQLLPGTDTALALSLLHVIIRRELFDSDFVEHWTVGFAELEKQVAPCTPEWGQKITRVPAASIVKAAELYAGAESACITRCVSLDQLHDSVQACRSVSLLAAVSGNIGIPGGNVLASRRGDISQNTHEFIGSQFLDPASLPLRRGYDRFPLLCGDLSPVPSAHMPSLWETIATGRPYPVKAALIFGSNAVVSYSNARRVREALESLDFLVVSDLFMTPTAELADLVLPASSWLERNNVISSFQTSPTYTVVQRRATGLGEARSDIDIICDLARRLGVGESFWSNDEGLHDALLSPLNMSFRELAEKRRLYAPLEYRQYEQRGFDTPSGKVELYSSLLESAGCAPLPGYTPAGAQPPEGTGGTGGKSAAGLLLTTGGRLPFFRHTENRRNPLLAEHCPHALVLIHPAAAQERGIAADDWVIVETDVGRARGRACLTEGLHPDVVQAVPGWAGEENINRVVPWGSYAEGMGTVPMRGLPCRLRRLRRPEEVDD